MEWTPMLETTLFQGIILYRPLGIHRHVRHILIQRYIMNNMGILVPLDAIKEKLEQLYDVEYTETIQNQDFELPYEDYEELKAVQRKADESSQEEEVQSQKSVKKKRIVKRKRK
jgi:hypothetical protein